jgi:hypothetical protein
MKKKKKSFKVDFSCYNIAGKKYCEAVRIEPAYLDNNGKAFWQLRSCNDEYSILLQGNFQN